MTKEQITEEIAKLDADLAMLAEKWMTANGAKQAFLYMLEQLDKPAEEKVGD